MYLAYATAGTQREAGAQLGYRRAMDIRRLTEADLDLLREVRLEALAEAPYAFCSALERERAFAPEHWEAQACDAGNAAFAARESGRTLAMAGCAMDDDPAAATLWGLWVAPEARGRRLAGALIAAAADWARAQGASRLRLEVLSDPRCEPARATYVRAGFVVAGSDRAGAQTMQLNL